MINSRKIEDLNPIVASLCRQFIDKCDKVGISVIITSTYRDKESQEALYSIGRTKPGRKVTNAMAGKSWHQYKIAFDFCPIVNGKAIWNDPGLFERCGEIAESCGLEWGGRWKKFKDMPHCQYTQGHTLAYFQNGGRLA